MILQRVLFTNSEETGALYLRKAGTAEVRDGVLAVGAGVEVTFDTYFGAFSIGKWKKYTDIATFDLHVEVEGDFSLRVFCRKEDETDEETFSSDVSGKAEVPLSMDSGAVWFSLTAKTGGKILSADFRTAEPAKHDVSLCAVICTYRREEFVKKNVDVLRKLSRGALKDKLFTFVIDNGQTLPDFSDETVRVLKNKNAGGAGGFTRGLIEGLLLRANYPFSHYLLMDDDVAFEPESILRTAALLSYRKEEYLDAFVSGGMLRLDAPTIQAESADFWDLDRGAVVPRKHNFDLADFRAVVKNEVEEPINYSSWWFCAMPAETVREDNLPLPLFIKRDDIEYGLRNGKRFLTLNGIGVWHEPFEKKRPAMLEYYYIRNRLALDFSLGIVRSKKGYGRWLLKETLLSCLRFRYNEAEATLRGAEDFCRGVEWLGSVDPILKNDEVRHYNAATTPVSEEELALCVRPIVKTGKKAKLLRLITLNGWLLPAKKTVLVPTARPSYKLFFGAKRALNYDPETKTGYYTEKNIAALFGLLRKYRKVRKDFCKKYDILLKEYATIGQDLKTLRFWKKYLELGE